MFAFFSQLLRPRFRHFVLLDRHGICRALRQSRYWPEGNNWVEVEECLPTWLDRPLPGYSRAQLQSSSLRERKRLALS